MAGRVASSHKWSDSRHSHSDGHGRPHVPARARTRSLLCFLLGVGCTLGLMSLRLSAHSTLPSIRHQSADQDIWHEVATGDTVQRHRNGEPSRRHEALVQPPPWQQSLPSPSPPESSQAHAEQGFVTREQLAAMARRLASNGTIIMTVSNRGYQDFLENWMVFAARLGLDRHLLVMAEDAESWEHAERLWPGHAVRLHVPEMEDANEDTVRALGLQGAGGTGAAGGEASEFNSPRFKKMMYRRVFYVRELLFARVNVLLTDTDIVFLRNPLPFMHGAEATGVPERPFDLMGMLDEPDWKGFKHLVPYPVQQNASLQFLTKSNFCGGFLFFRCSPGAWVMVDLLAMKLFQAAKRTGKENEQTFLALVMWESLQLKPPARIAILPQQLFVPGWLYFTDKKYGWWRQAFKRRTKDPPVVVHNNWIVGREAKIQRFISKGLWAKAAPKEQTRRGVVR